MRQQMRRRIGYLLEFLTGELRIFREAWFMWADVVFNPGRAGHLEFASEWLYGTVQSLSCTLPVFKDR